MRLLNIFALINPLLVHINDENICGLLKRHDPRGCSMLSEKYYRPLVLWADTFLNDIPASEDIVQEFLVTFLEKRIYARMEMTNLRGYLFTSIKNATLKHIEKRDPLRNSYQIDNIIVEWIEPDNITEEMLREVEAKIENLPPRMRDVLKAVYVDGLRYKEVAEKLSISIATVNTLLVRGLKRLREIFMSKK